MPQELSLQDKLNILNFAGVYPLLGQHACNSGMAGCCGSIRLDTAASAYGGRKEILRRLPKRIYWEPVELEDVPEIALPETLLVPDLAGNVLIQWEDE